MSDEKRTYSLRFDLKGGNVVKAELLDIAKVGEKSMKSLGDRVSEAAKKFAKLDAVKGALNSIKNVFLGVSAVAGGMVYAGKQALDYAGNLQDLSQTAGISVEAFQELSYVGLQFGIDTEKMAGSLNKFIGLADEFATSGGGGAADGFERLGLSQSQVNKGLEDSEALFLDVIQKIRETGDVASQIDLANKFFGKEGGKAFVRMIQDSASHIALLRAEARQMGFVLSEEMIAKADDAGDRLAALGEILKVRFYAVFIENADVIYDFADGIIRTLPSAIQKLEDLAEAIGLLEKSPMQRIKEIRDDLKSANEELEKYNSLQSVMSHPIDAASAFNAKMSAVHRKNAFLTEIGVPTDSVQMFDEKQGPNVPENWVSPRSKVAPVVPRVSRSSGGRGGRSYRSDKAAESESAKQADEIKKKIEAQKEELVLIGMSARAQAVLRAEQDLGSAATMEQKEAVRQLALEIYDGKKAVENYNSAVNSLTSSLDGGLNDALQGNMKTWDDWGNFALKIVQDVANQMLRLQGITGEGGLTSSLAEGILGAFGMGKPSVSSGRAAGGPVSAGNVYRIREIQDEVFVPNVSGQMVPTSKLGGGGNVVINVVNNTPAQVTTRTAQNSGGKEILLMIDQAVASNLRSSSSATRSALSALSSDNIIRR
mgnify:CR=1 FL=1